MTRAEYFQKQKELSKTTARAEAESIRRIRKVTRELVIPLVRQYAEEGSITFPKEELARQIDHIIREEGAKPVMVARKLHEDMEASLAEKLGIIIRRRAEPQKNAKQRRLNAKRKPIGESIILPGRGWGYGTGTKGVAGYYRDPQTGKIVWTDLPLEYQFAKRADLSTLVWEAVEEQEQMVFDVVQGGRALGRNVKDISGDLETFIKYHDGGERVVGRWMGMFPNTEAGRKEAWQREYLAAHGGLQPGSDAAKVMLKQPDAQAWVKQKMEETTKRGTPRLPAAVKQYAVRLGKAGLDYRAIRIARTETTAMLADEQVEIAENSAISTGEMDFVMERGRDHWNCNCEHYAEQNPWRVDDPERPEIPVHPNCVPAGTKVLTENGLKNIENIELCDFVVGYTGKLRRILKIYNSPYVGEVFSVNSGLANFTFNHPVFVYGRGWVEAQGLKYGDCLITSESMPLCPDSKNLPANGFKKFSLFSILRYLFVGSVPTSAVNFNSNLSVGDSYVDVIYPNGKKRGCFYAIIPKQLVKDNFVNRKPLFFLNADGTSLSVNDGTLASTDSVMSRRRTGNLKFFRSIFIKIINRLLTGLKWKSCFDKTPAQSITLNSNKFRIPKKPARIFHKLSMNFFYIFHRFRVLFGHNLLYYTITVNAIEKSNVNENVYNLTVEKDHTFFANGILTHNCMCQWRPRLKTDAEIIAAFKEEMAEDLETIEGTQKQKDILEQIDLKTNLHSDSPYNEGIFNYLKSEHEHGDLDYDVAMEKIHAMLNPVATEWHIKLSEIYGIDDYGISSYTSDEFENMNLYLLGKRDDEELLSVEADPEDIKYKIESASDALSKYKLEENIVTWKATKLKHYADYQEGQIYTYPAFHSSSVDFNAATNARDKDLLIKFIIPKGIQGAYVGNNVGLSNEDEFTIQKGLNYKVIERGKVMHRGTEKHLLVLQIVN